MRTNLGIILQSSTVQNANGQRLEQLQALLPTVTGSGSISVEQVNLAAYGLKFPGLNPIIGPFQVEDFQASLSQTLFSLPRCRATCRQSTTSRVQSCRRRMPATLWC